MTFGPYAGEDSSRYLVLEEKVRIVSRYWEISGAEDAERLRYGNKQRLHSRFGLAFN